MALSRRRFVAAAGGAALTLGSAGLAPRVARAQRKTLRIVQWSHFVPGYDAWFDGTFCKAWGEKHDTDVRVDHISIGEINARAAAEVSTQRGHDLFMFLSPPAAYGKQVIDHAEIYEQVAKKHGRPVDLAHKSTFDPKAKRYFAFSPSYVPDPGHYRQDLWAQVGYPRGPDSWDEVRSGARAIRERFGNACGLGLSQELDTNMAVRALLWSFGGSLQDEAGKVVLDSRQTVEALKFMRAIHQESQTPEVFTWDPSSNNRGVLSGKLSYVVNAISIMRTAEKDDPAMARKLQLVRAAKGPVRRMAAEHVMECYVIWKFAENKDAAKQFLVDYVDAFADAFKASELYNLPCFPQTCPDLAQQLARDARASPPDKYAVLATSLDWTANVGYPGYATAAVDEVFNAYLLPTMFATVARGEVSPEDAARTADREAKRLFDKWK
jgi:multiple sugar transport system substrate-binding protein